MKTVTFSKKCQYGAKGESRSVTDLSAAMFLKLGLIEKEAIPEVETKDPDPVEETKELIPEVETKAKVTTSPKEAAPVKTKEKPAKGKK